MSLTGDENLITQSTQSLPNPMYTTLLGQQLYYQKVGKGQNLILLHGWANDASSFWGVVEELKKDFTLYLIDLPGFGRSELPKRAFFVKDYADVIKEFISKGKIKDPIVLGHSVGGRIAIKLAAHNPNLLKKLVLEDAAGIRPKRDIPKFLFYIIAKIMKVIIPNIFHLREKIRTWFYKTLESDYLNVGPMKNTFTNILNEDLTPELSKIKAETLLIWGEKDPTLEASPGNGKLMYKLIPNSRIEFIENVGHHPHIENPTMFIYWVRNFLT